MEHEVVQEAAGLMSNPESIKTIMTGLTIIFGGVFPALAIGKMAAKAVESIGRNPEAASAADSSSGNPGLSAPAPLHSPCARRGRLFPGRTDSRI